MQTTNYLYDGSNSVAEMDAASNLLARYAQGAGIDAPLATVRGGAVGYYGQDGLGSVTSLSNSTAALANTYTYDAFGNIAASTGAFTNLFQYTGRDTDSETGLLYYRARYYDPATGRFISEDPTGFGDGVNFYRYVHNDPIDNIDPDGLTTYQGFSADKEVQMRNAVDKAIKKLREGCGSSCAGKDGPEIINILENATFVYQPKQKACGQTGPLSLLGFRHKFGVGPLAFEPNRCCLLESTLVHEVVHGMKHPGDKRPDQVEKSCFGCVTPE